MSGADTPLPRLREDLQLYPGAPQPDGSPCWVIHDPVRNLYFEIGRDALDLLELWGLGSVSRVVSAARAELGRIVSAGEVTAFAGFLHDNALATGEGEGAAARLMAQYRAAKRSLLGTLLHNYLFFRVPLVRPDRFLRATWPWVAPFFTRASALIFLLLGVSGLYLAGRQWDHFAAQFGDFLSLEGAVFYALALIAVKSLHELGHAWMAARFGLRVPAIGVAFLVLVPVLYTDTSDAWRLPSRRGRVLIDAAGMMVELALAAVATWVWVLAPDGLLRSIAFAVAAVSWIGSLAVNLTPWMRFDGYYLLADLIGVQNLQARSFALARWRLREILFGLGAPPPELMAAGKRRFLVLFAWTTWIYRLVLFIAIALLVYHLFAKILGIVLFAVEIAWFVALPILREVRAWWSLRAEIAAARRVFLTGGLALGVIAACFVPWSTPVRVPAMLEAVEQARIFPPVPGIVAEVHVRDGDAVQAGDLLYRLSSPALAHDLARETRRLDLTRLRLGSIAADSEDRALRTVLEREEESGEEAVAGLRRQIAALDIRAPVAGRVRDADPEVRPGLAVHPTRRLALIVADGADAAHELRGYVPEDARARIAPGDPVVFVPDNRLLPTLRGTVRALADTGVEEVDMPALAVPHGGPLRVDAQPDGRLVPRQGLYPVRIALDGGGDIGSGKAERGIARIDGRAESLAARIARRVAAVLIRESGF
ncbi:MAG: biotin/lipoyl-binding protein [Alphaproteobacteria bacterium]|nr:biotin/lipoyl-binding protein [Alphaproteobacteria bacterium]MDX5370336.1 biotin/lipoyl-binding protein [Alphaproteobacteria bacterium]MDX5464874.1 biotin/lipoyl-binding protein [Alphaproteobacteria bacterium]